ncbi:MAG: S-layer homology domain-containing protein [Defluviitaleaceae bacterium]|nr:S-layer homology domain-containing protein [Defluviitaleaceae bacterium]
MNTKKITSKILAWVLALALLLGTLPTALTADTTETTETLDTTTTATSDLDETTETTDTTVTASSATHTVTFKLGYIVGDTPMEEFELTVADGEALGENFPEEPTRLGFQFQRWAYNSGGSTATFTAETIITADTLVQAEWQLINYSITYDLDGGTATGNPTAYNITTTPAITLSNPTKEGFAFAGWTGTGLTVPTVNVTIPWLVSVGDRHYTATWTLPILGGNEADGDLLEVTITNNGGVIPRVWNLNYGSATDYNWQHVYYSVASVSNGNGLSLWNDSTLIMQGGYFTSYGYTIALVSKTVDENGTESIIRTWTSTNVFASGIEILETFRLEKGASFYTRDIEIINNSGTAMENTRLYIGGDVYLAGSDSSYGDINTDYGLAFCYRDTDDIVMSLRGITAPTFYHAAYYSDGRTHVITGQNLANTISPSNLIDTGYYLQWGDRNGGTNAISIPSGGSYTIQTSEAFTKQELTWKAGASTGALEAVDIDNASDKISVTYPENAGISLAHVVAGLAYEPFNASYAVENVSGVVMDLSSSPISANGGKVYVLNGDTVLRIYDLGAAIAPATLRTTSFVYDINGTRFPHTILDTNGHNVVSLAHGTATLVQGTDWTRTDSEYTIRAAFLDNFNVGDEIVLTFNMTGGENPTFTINITDSARNITAVAVPDNAQIDGTDITADVANDTASIAVDVTVSDNATWKLYSDEDCTTEITGAWGLSHGGNIAYIEVTAYNNATRVYTVMVYRAKASQDAPSAFALTYEYNAGTDSFTVTIPEIPNAEYSFDNVTFSQTRTTTASYSESVTGYARYAETPTHYESMVTSGTVTLPNLSEGENGEDDENEDGTSDGREDGTSDGSEDGTSDGSENGENGENGNGENGENGGNGDNGNNDNNNTIDGDNGRLRISGGIISSITPTPIQAPSDTANNDPTTAPDNIPSWVNIFSDITEGAWYYNAVAFVSERGLFHGYGNGIFAPHDSMTRAMFVTVLHNLEGRPAPSGQAWFTDVAVGSWQHDSVQWAAENGIVSGIGGGLFVPNRPINRQEMASILSHYADHKGIQLPALRDITNFTDLEDVDNWAKMSVERLAQAGIINGDNNTLMPKKEATRAEVAQVFMNFLRVV